MGQSALDDNAVSAKDPSIKSEAFLPIETPSLRSLVPGIAKTAQTETQRSLHPGATSHVAWGSGALPLPTAVPGGFSGTGIVPRGVWDCDAGDLYLPPPPPLGSSPSDGQAAMASSPTSMPPWRRASDVAVLQVACKSEEQQVLALINQLQNMNEG